jgi:hypothetical protein
MMTNPSALAMELRMPDPDAIDADIKMGSTRSFRIAMRAYVREPVYRGACQLACQISSAQIASRHGQVD